MNVAGMDVSELLALRTAASVLVAFVVTVGMAMLIRSASPKTRWIQESVASSCNEFDDAEAIVGKWLTSRKAGRGGNAVPKDPEVLAKLANALALRDVGWKVFFVGMYIANLSVIAPAVSLFAK